MATNTTNLGLIKPSGTDKIRIAQINQNMDILDEKIGQVGDTSLQAQVAAVDSGLAIVSNGNTHVAITSGQYVYIRNHSSLSEGLYKATAAIAANVALTTSNVTKLTTGSANDLKNSIDSLNSHIEAHWFGNNTLANIQTAMVSFAQDVPDGGVRSIEFGISTASGKFGATNYIGKLERISGSRLCVTVMNAMYSANMIIGNYKDGTWYWDEVALSSQVTKTGYNMNQWMSSLEDSDNSGYMWAQGNLRVITFQGKRRTHTEDEILFTLPAEHRPAMTVRCAGSYNGSSVVISLNTDGTGVLFVANGVTATGRIYFSAAFMH